MGCGFVLHTLLSKRVVDSLVALGNISIFQDTALVILYALIVCSNSSCESSKGFTSTRVGFSVFLWWLFP